jgi:hypothetical protein
MRRFYDLGTPRASVRYRTNGRPLGMEQDGCLASRVFRRALPGMRSNDPTRDQIDSLGHIESILAYLQKLEQRIHSIGMVRFSIWRSVVLNRNKAARDVTNAAGRTQLTAGRTADG